MFFRKKKVEPVVAPPTLRPPVDERTPFERAVESITNGGVFLSSRRETLLAEIAERQNELSGIEIAIKAFDAADDILHTTPIEGMNNDPR